MEHIIQFAVGIDDDAIVKNVTKHAEESITKELTQQVRDRLFESGYYKQHATEKDPLNAYSDRLLTKWLDDHKDEIVDKAAKFLAEKLARTKVVKERVAKEIE